MKNHGFVGAAMHLLALGLLIVWMAAWPTANAWAAAVNVDSLLQVEASLPMDTAHVDDRLDISFKVRSSQPDQSLKICQRALQIAKEAKDDALLSMAYNSLGGCYRVLNRYEEALGALQSASKHFQASGNESGLAQVYLNIGSIHLTRTEEPLAKVYLLKARTLIEKLNIAKYKGTLYTNLAIVYTNEGSFPEALSLYDSTLAFYKANDDVRSIALTYANIGYVRYVEGNYEEALKFTMLGADLAGKNGFKYEQASSLQNHLEALNKLGRYNEAARYLDTLETLVRQMESPEMVAQLYQVQAAVHEGRGQPEEALQALKRYQSLRDSLNSEEKKAKVAEVQAQLDLTLKEGETAVRVREEALAEQEARAARMVMIALLVGLALAVTALMLLVFLLLANKRATKLLRHANQTHLEHGILVGQQNDALRLNNERLEDLNREKDGLISIVAHDLKSPLNKALGLTDLIAISGPLNPRQEQALNMLNKVATAGNEMIRDLLDLNAIEHEGSKLTFEPLSLSFFLSEISRSFSGAAVAKAISITVDCSEGLQLTTDRPYLSRVLENIISNAIKFSPKGKRVWISAWRQAQGVSISVRDEGPGISPADQAKLFKRFQRLTARPTAGESSTGLGLAITQTLVEKLGAKIQVESRLGEGTTFTVILPDSSDKR